MRDIKIVNIDGEKRSYRTNGVLTRISVYMRNRLKAAVIMAIANRNLDERIGVSISSVCEEAITMWLKHNDLEAYHFSARKENSEEEEEC